VRMPSGNALGEYLRARRELVSPESAGIPHIGRRRVPGLRRDELSLLSGVSTDYYVRLEQGRDRNPSPQVLDALARALQLDDEATRTCTHSPATSIAHVAPHSDPSACPQPSSC
jgi:transcriptional regulator with XRE-family HTH domain